MSFNEYYNSRYSNSRYNRGYRKVKWTSGDDGDTYDVHKPDSQYDCEYRGYKIRNFDRDGGYIFEVQDDNGNAISSKIYDFIPLCYDASTSGCIDKIKEAIDMLIRTGRIPDLEK